MKCEVFEIIANFLVISKVLPFSPERLYIPPSFSEKLGVFLEFIQINTDLPIREQNIDIFI